MLSRINGQMNPVYSQRPIPPITFGWNADTSVKDFNDEMKKRANPASAKRLENYGLQNTPLKNARIYVEEMAAPLKDNDDVQVSLPTAVREQMQKTIKAYEGWVNPHPSIPKPLNFLNKAKRTIFLMMWPKAFNVQRPSRWTLLTDAEARKEWAANIHHAIESFRMMVDHDEPVHTLL